MRVSYSTLVKAKRAGRATSVRVTPTGTAVTEYQVPLGQRHSLSEAGVIGLPSWSEKTTQTETWAKVPRLSATCPRRIVAFDGGRGDIDKCMEFGDEFDGTALDTSKWTNAGGTPTFAGGIITLGDTSSYIQLDSKILFGSGTAIRSRLKADTYTEIASWGYGTGGVSTYRFGSEISGASQYEANSYGTSLQWTPLGASYTGWHTWDVIRTPTPSQIYRIDGSVVATHATQTSTTAKPVSLLVDKFANMILCDSIFVRKYTANEPLAGTAAPSATNRAISRPLSHADLMRACCT